jgi:predicted nucleic acid-binding protein
MSLLVVDASVVIKWFIPEVHWAAATRLQSTALQLHVPGLFDVEVGNIFWKKVLRGELTLDKASQMVAAVTLLQLTRHADRELIPTAFGIASASGRTVYDSLYVALAMQLGGRMVTADERLRNALKGTTWEQYVLWVEDVP